MLCQRRVSRTGQTRFQKALGLGHTLFDADGGVKGPGGAAVELHCPFHVCVKGFDHALQFWEELEETVSADKIKRLCEVNESDIQRHLLFSALL